MSETLSYFEKYIQEGSIDKDKPLQLAFTPQKTKEIYHTAYHLYREQQYDQAIHLFRLLTILSPTESKYWKGLGACSQMQDDYEHALCCYTCAQILNTDQPDPYLYVHAADCYFALENIEQGFRALEGAQLSAEERNDERVLHHVDLMRKLWSNESNS